MKNSKISYDLCQDLIIEIFTRLPVRSLLRFRSLSKSLCACIGSPDFIRLHTLRSQEKVMIVHELNHEGVDNPCSPVYTLHSESQLSSSPYTSVTAAPFTDFKILGSSNGIICLLELGKGRINLWNPSTRRKLTVRQPYFVFGFGYDPVIDDYKIVKSTVPGPQQVYSMYTLKTDTWCKIRGPAPPDSYLYFPVSCQCLFNGTLHWVATGRLIDQSGAHISFSNMMTFDLSTNVFSSFALPQHDWGTSVTIIQGYLAVMSPDNDNTWIWVRKEESSGNSYSWSVAFKFEATGSIKRRSWDQVLQLTADGDLLLSDFYEGIFVYNHATNVQSRLEKLKGSKRVCAMEMCVESLGLLHMGTSC